MRSRGPSPRYSRLTSERRNAEDRSQRQSSRHIARFGLISHSKDSVNAEPNGRFVKSLPSGCWRVYLKAGWGCKGRRVFEAGLKGGAEAKSGPYAVSPAPLLFLRLRLTSLIPNTFSLPALSSFCWQFLWPPSWWPLPLQCRLSLHGGRLPCSCASSRSRPPWLSGRSRTEMTRVARIRMRIMPFSSYSDELHVRLQASGMESGVWQE